MIEGLFKTGCGHRGIQAARSIPDVDVGRLGVGNVASILMIAAPAMGQVPTHRITGRMTAPRRIADSQISELRSFNSSDMVFCPRAKPHRSAEHGEHPRAAFVGVSFTNRLGWSKKQIA